MSVNLNEKHIKERFKNIHWTLFLANSSLTELYYILQVPYNKSELNIVNGQPFSFYKITLQYCFVVEYIKLLVSNKRKDENISSLFHLNDAIKNSKGKPFENSHNENVSELLRIKESMFYCKIQELRDKKIAHSEKHSSSIPFQVKDFTSNDFIFGFKQLKKIAIIINNCAKIYDFEIIINSESGTHDFIKYHAEYQDYYFRNYKIDLNTKRNN